MMGRQRGRDDKSECASSISKWQNNTEGILKTLNNVGTHARCDLARRRKGVRSKIEEIEQPRKAAEEGLVLATPSELWVFLVALYDRLAQILAKTYKIILLPFLVLVRGLRTGSFVCAEKISDFSIIASENRLISVDLQKKK